MDSTITLQVTPLQRELLQCYVKARHGGNIEDAVLDMALKTVHAEMFADDALWDTWDAHLDKLTQEIARWREMSFAPEPESKPLPASGTLIPLTQNSTASWRFAVKGGLDNGTASSPHQK